MLDATAASERSRTLIQILSARDTPWLICRRCGLSLQEACACDTLSPLGGLCLPRDRVVAAMSVGGDLLWDDLWETMVRQGLIARYEEMRSDTMNLLLRAVARVGGIGVLSGEGDDGKYFQPI